MVGKEKGQDSGQRAEAMAINTSGRGGHVSRRPDISSCRNSLHAIACPPTQQDMCSPRTAMSRHVSLLWIGACWRVQTGYH